jgi:lipoprotein-anchoring transpeptidase ErfK/SrfK
MAPSSTPPTTDAIETNSQPSSKKVNLTGKSYENAKKAALEMIDRNEFKEALATLSVYYNSPDLSVEQSQDLLNLLDSLAGETIYSRRHLLDTPYVVGPGESIESIAKRFEVPADLLAKINGVDPNIGAMPGTKLKIFQGPFRAEIDVKRNEMTIFLGDGLYAGRFPISTGSDPQPKAGTFTVVDKQRDRNYYGAGGLQIDGKDPRNPYGGWWIDLGEEQSIHGSAESQAGENTKLGCISLSPLDAGDVFTMLSRGSKVTIKR